MYRLVKPKYVARMLLVRLSTITLSAVVLKGILAMLVLNVTKVIRRGNHFFYLYSAVLLCPRLPLFNFHFFFVVGGCRNNDACPSNQACVNGQCQNPCRCGFGAVCEVYNHSPVCKCPPGTVGNPMNSCTSMNCQFVNYSSAT